MLITLLSYYMVGNDCVYIYLNAYYLITLLLLVVWLCVLYICLNAYYLITLLLLVVVLWLCIYLFKCLLPYYLITIVL